MGQNGRHGRKIVVHCCSPLCLIVFNAQQCTVKVVRDFVILLSYGIHPLVKVGLVPKTIHASQAFWLPLEHQETNLHCLSLLLNHCNLIVNRCSCQLRLNHNTMFKVRWNLDGKEHTRLQQRKVGQVHLLCSHQLMAEFDFPNIVLEARHDIHCGNFFQWHHHLPDALEKIIGIIDIMTLCTEIIIVNCLHKRILDVDSLLGTNPLRYWGVCMCVGQQQDHSTYKLTLVKNGMTVGLND